MAMFSLYDLQPDLPPITVLDVGAADSVEFPPPFAGLVAAGHAHIIGFEPDAQACAHLNTKYGAPHRFLPLFIGTGGPAKFHRTTRPDTGSLFAPNVPLLGLFTDLAPNMLPVDVVDVETTRLDDVADIDDVDYIAIDVQGSELAVFEGATRALSTAVAIQTEIAFVELYHGQPLFADIDRHLRANDFWFHTFVGMASMSMRPLRVGNPDLGLNQRLWADAVYTRSPLRFDALSTVKLRKLAVVSHDVYRSYDLAHLCLVAADARDGGTLSQRYFNRLMTL
jgi:FkbM family methyltransferase